VPAEALCTAYISHSSTVCSTIFQRPIALFSGLIRRVSLEAATCGARRLLVCYAFTFQ
jgi:hypothetical protein